VNEKHNAELNDQPIIDPYTPSDRYPMQARDPFGFFSRIKRDGSRGAYDPNAMGWYKTYKPIAPK
jgi:hypothetical protein